MVERAGSGGQCNRCGCHGHTGASCTADLPRPSQMREVVVLFDPDGVLELLRTGHPPTT